MKSKYLKTESKTDRGGFVGYIATRTGAVMNLEKLEKVKPTEKQIKLIIQLSEEFPSMKLLDEHKKYRYNPSIASASELIDAVCEEQYAHIGKKEDFLSYIAERPGVVKSGAHGLFTIEDQIDSLENIKEKIKDHDGHIWTHVLSLERADAIEFGFDTQEAWKHLLRKNHFKMAEAMKIQPQNFHWYAAFHDTAHHPHVHIIMYSDDPKQGYLSPKGIDSMKTFFATDIFKEPLSDVYRQKEEVKKQLKTEIADCLTQLSLVQENQTINGMMQDLRVSMKAHSGKKYYGYLSKDLKNEVDNIMVEIEKIPEVDNLLQKWKQLRLQQYEIYSDSKEPDFSFVHDKTFRPLKNMIIAIAASPDDELKEMEDELIKMQLSGKKPQEVIHDEQGTSVWMTTCSLIRYLSKIIQKSTNIKSNHVQSDKMQRIKEKHLKVALGQNENDTHQFG